MSKRLTNRYVIWSNEHNAWWGPNEVGYTNILALAGRYTQTQAHTICTKANLGLGPNEMPNEFYVLDPQVVGA